MATENIIAVDSIESLKNLTGLTQGQYVRTFGYYPGTSLGGGLFKVTSVGPNYCLSFLENNKQTIKIPALAVDWLAIAPIFTMKFRISSANTYSGSGALYLLTTLQSSSQRTSIMVNNFDHVNNTFNLSDDKCIFKSVKNKYNVAINPSDPLSFDEWYEVSVTARTPTSSVDINKALRVGGAYDENTTIDIAWFNIEWFENNSPLPPISHSEYFSLNEGTGSSVTGDLGTIGTLDGTILPTWNNYDSNNSFFEFETIDGTILTRQVEYNTVTPFDFGAISNENVTDFINDSTSAIQNAIDSGYNVKIPPSKLYITTPIEIKSPIQIEMFGSFVPMADISTSGSILDSDLTTTIIYSDQNIDYITIQSHNVKISNGLLYTAESLTAQGGIHNKAGIRFDLNFRIWNADIVGVTVYGNKEQLPPANEGTIAFHIDGENLNSVGYLTEGSIDGRAYNCGTGVFVTEVDPNPSGSFVNNISFTVMGDGCKVFYNIETGSMFTVKTVCQDRPILTLAQSTNPDYTAFQIKCDKSVLDAFVFDTGKGPDPSGTYHRHAEIPYKVLGANDIVGLMQDYMRNTNNVADGRLEANRSLIFNDPHDLIIMNKSGAVSQLNNAILFAGNSGNVSYKGYKAPNTSWFEQSSSNFNPAPDCTPPLSVDTNVQIIDGEYLLTSDSRSGVTPGHQINVSNLNDIDLYFSEIVIDDLENIQNFSSSKLVQIILKTAGEAIKAIHCILHFDAGIEQIDISSDSPLAKDGLFKLYDNAFMSTHKNDKIQKIILRLVGQELKLNGTTPICKPTYIRDLFAETQYSYNAPQINIGGGQSIYGQHTIDETLIADEFRYKNKNETEFSGKVLQIKKDSFGSIGLYNLNTNDQIEEGIEYNSVTLVGGIQSSNLCNVIFPNELTSSNGTIDFIFHLFDNYIYVNNSDITVELYSVYNSVTTLEETLTTKFRSPRKTISLSIPVSKTYASNTEFYVKVLSSKTVKLDGSGSLKTILRITKSILLPEPGATVTNIPDPTTATTNDIAIKMNELLDSLRNGGFIS